MSARWVHFAVPSVALADLFSEYRIAIQSGDTAGVVRDFSDRHTFVDGAADTPGIETTGEGTLSVYATYSFPL
jgi:hypothetical protein